MEPNIAYYIDGIMKGNYSVLARAISMVENDNSMSLHILEQIKISAEIPVIGFTGPPGAGKSTLIRATVENYVKKKKRVAVVAVDPSSPFNRGALLGDRIRLGALLNHPDVYIRSLSSRGALGGLSYKTIEIVDLLRSSNFDAVIIETVGVGQSEVDVIGLADRVVVVLVPESGDEIQHFKSGIMEIADLFVINKADRPGADLFSSSLKKVLLQNNKNIGVLKTNAEEEVGTRALFEWIESPLIIDREKVLLAMTERALRLIVHKQVRSIDKRALFKKLEEQNKEPDFNLYRFIAANY